MKVLPCLALGFAIAVRATSGAWAADSGPAGEVAKGKEVFQYWCVACHGEGPMKPGTTALQAKYNGKLPARLEERLDLTPELTKFFVRNGVNVMPPFRKTEISDADLKALGAYLARSRP